MVLRSTKSRNVELHNANTKVSTVRSADLADSTILRIATFDRGCHSFARSGLCSHNLFQVFWTSNLILSYRKQTVEENLLKLISHFNAYDCWLQLLVGYVVLLKLRHARK
jgi:hypothetical protein